MPKTLSEPTSEQWYFNPAARTWSRPAPVASSNGVSPTAFHRSLPGYAPTPLVSLPTVAARLGVHSVLLKDESSRLGLPAFKILGASFAIFLALCDRAGLSTVTTTMGDLRDHNWIYLPVLVAATDGNHGRAVARSAAMLGLRADIFVPASVSTYSRERIASEGATVTIVNASYDEAVRQAAAVADDNPSTHLLIQDTSWDGYEEVPINIVAGYTTLFSEVDSQLNALKLPPATHCVVPVGVGSLAHAATLHYRQPSTEPHTTSLLSVEPTHAPCLLTSLLAGDLRSISTTDTIMPGLNCGTPSQLAWSDLREGIDSAVSITDDQALDALSELDALGVDAGPCGAATLAGLYEAQLQSAHAGASYLNSNSVIILISTEGSEVFLGDTAKPLPSQRLVLK